MQTIDLTRFTSRDEIVLSGRPKGEELRKKLELDKIEDHEQNIMVVIPQHIVSLNSSFFLGLFTESIRKFGENGFRDKYTFVCRPILIKDIEAGIHQATNTSNPLLAPK